MKAARLFYLSMALCCSALLGFGYYLQFVQGLEPCPLCIFQRIAYMSIAAVALVGLIHGPGPTAVRVYSGLMSLGALAGTGIAGRQVWLQHLPPDRVPECGPGLDYMLQVFSFSETLEQVFTGAGECAAVQWAFLGLSIAEWSLLWFIFLLSVSLRHCLRGRLLGKESFI